MPAELHYAADIGSLCRRREIADGHVLDHTATERAHLGHLGTSCPKGWAVDTLILADRRRPSRPLSFCRDSGFVQSRFAHCLNQSFATKSALNGPSNGSLECPLSGVKQPRRWPTRWSQDDPFRTF